MATVYALGQTAAQAWQVTATDGSGNALAVAAPGPFASAPAALAANGLAWADLRIVPLSTGVSPGDEVDDSLAAYRFHPLAIPDPASPLHPPSRFLGRTPHLPFDWPCIPAIPANVTLPQIANTQIVRLARGAFNGIKVTFSITPSGPGNTTTYGGGASQYSVTTRTTGVSSAARVYTGQLPGYGQRRFDTSKPADSFSSSSGAILTLNADPAQDRTISRSTRTTTSTRPGDMTTTETVALCAPTDLPASIACVFFRAGYGRDVYLYVQIGCPGVQAYAPGTFPEGTDPYGLATFVPTDSPLTTYTATSGAVSVFGVDLSVLGYATTQQQFGSTGSQTSTPSLTIEEV